MLSVPNYPAHNLDRTSIVEIMAVETPYRIYATRTDRQRPREELLEYIQEHDRSRLHRLLDEKGSSGCPVLVIIDNEIYRGAIIERPFNSGAIRDWLGDYAIEKRVNIENLFVMPALCKGHPWQAFVCGLAGIHPVEGETWTSSTCERIRRALVGREFIMRTLYPDETTEALWVDFVINDNEEGVTSIADELLKYELARPANERVKFNWDDDIGGVCDRRRAAEIERKLSLRMTQHCLGDHVRELEPCTRIEDTVETQDVRRPDEGDWDLFSSSSLQNQSFSYDDQPVSTEVQRLPVYSLAINSCGESDDNSDVE